MALRPNSNVNAALPTARVIPAQVNFLTIYNPTLGDTDETEEEQIVFWIGKDELGTNRPGRRLGKSSKDHPKQDGTVTVTSDMTEEQVLNDKMRQIGLARGMVDFARNFANDDPLDTIETDRSRIVLHELEKDWWILASIDLTRLPPTASQAKSSDSSSKESSPVYEYSAREVSSAVLLRAQLIKAHNLFLMHHTTGLWELHHKLGRPNFCALLNRYWEGFARNWDVLLHGNPAVDIHGDCIKLAGGGELGVGVGEEEWGSGEREVLEGFIERADGLVECIVGRYGAAPPDKSKGNSDREKNNWLSLEEKMKLEEGTGPQLWLGNGDDPGPADGIIFSGTGRISRKSLATVSQWMEAIFKYGDAAYGVGENPASRPRQRRKRPKHERQVSDEASSKARDGVDSSPEAHPRSRSTRNKAPDLRRQAMENSAAPPGIPAPLVGAVERSLDEAVAKAAQRSSSKSPQTSPKSSPVTSPGKERNQEDAMKGFSATKDESSVFSMGSMKSIFTLGYGSSWTLNPNGFEKKDEPSNDTKPNAEPPKSRTITKSPEPKSQPQQPTMGGQPSEGRLQEIDPTPEVSDEDTPFVQELEQSIGKFLIGLSGDLENMEFNDSDEPTNFLENNRKGRSQRIFLRTLTVHFADAQNKRPGLDATDRKYSQSSNLSKASAESRGGARSNNGPEPKTSAAASVDGAQPRNRFEKVQVAVYVHQPFIFVFLFELHTPKLTMPSFYRTIHHSLGPLQKPLLQRTDPTRVTERIATALNEKASAAVSAVKKHVDNNGNAIYDLVYDPSKNTIRTSLPNIPIPNSPNSAIRTSSTISGSWYTLGIPVGTSNSPSASRLDPGSAKNKLEPWTRVEALNVHTQILNTFSATRRPKELERTVVTSRGWWVVWMKVSPPGKESEEHKEAFLVRKSGDYTPSRQVKDSSTSGSPVGRWLLRDQSRDVSSGSAGSAALATGAKGVGEGVGINARKWIEGLLLLTQ